MLNVAIINQKKNKYLAKKKHVQNIVYKITRTTFNRFEYKTK